MGFASLPHWFFTNHLKLINLIPGGNQEHLEILMSSNGNIETILLSIVRKKLGFLEKLHMGFFFGKGFEKMYCTIIVFYRKMYFV